MKDKTGKPKAISAEESELIERMRRHPEIAQRIHEIFGLAENAEGPLKTADQIEELLIAELRKLGNVTMNQWASQAEKRVSEELKAQDPSVRSRKKKR